MTDKQGKTVVPKDLVVACCSDLAGKVRGKAFLLEDYQKRLQRGVGWTPTNVQITCFDAIAESPFGALGDLLLIPDDQTRVRLDYDDGLPAEDFVLADIVHTDGRPWALCTRALLKQALKRLSDVAGLSLFGAFEHEFHLKGGDGRQSAYSHRGVSAERAFASTFVGALDMAGLAPDTFMKEYGKDQYEVTIDPALGVTIADRAVQLREIAHATGGRLARPLSFTPLRDPAGVGNGVHVHLSFFDRRGRAVTYDAKGLHGLSAVAGSFVAGILKYLPDIIALTAPSVVSYLRLTPHRWSAAYNNLGFRDREAAVRICPVSDLSDVDVAKQFNIEFRAADAAASPHLQLATLIHAGVQGIEEGLATPAATEEDLSLLCEEALRAKGYARLPDSLEAALEALAVRPPVAGWFPDGFIDIYRQHKQGEIAFLAGKSMGEVCQAYEEAY